MKRKVIAVTNSKYSIHSHHGGSNILQLECGHFKRQKGNIKIPKFCNCKECDLNNNAQ